MFRVEDSPSPSCIVAEVGGHLTQLDYTLAQRAVQRAARGDSALSLAVRVGPIKQVSASFELSDLGVLRKVAKNLKRVALVTDDAAVRQGFHEYLPRARSYAPSFAAETRVFPESEFDAAVAWACAGVQRAQ